MAHPLLKLCKEYKEVSIFRASNIMSKACESILIVTVCYPLLELREGRGWFGEMVSDVLNIWLYAATGSAG